MPVTLKRMVLQETPVTHLHAFCVVRYWEDAEVNGVVDEHGKLMPFVNGDVWSPMIELETGKIVGWPVGFSAKVHYKVCDAGTYKLLNADSVVAVIEDYVPSIMCPGGDGYGDYVIMDINFDGQIQNWKVDLSEFETLE